MLRRGVMHGRSQCIGEQQQVAEDRATTQSTPQSHHTGSLLWNSQSHSSRSQNLRIEASCSGVSKSNSSRKPQCTAPAGSCRSREIVRVRAAGLGGALAALDSRAGEAVWGEAPAPPTVDSSCICAQQPLLGIRPRRDMNGRNSANVADVLRTVADLFASVHPVASWWSPFLAGSKLTGRQGLYWATRELRVLEDMCQLSESAFDISSIHLRMIRIQIKTSNVRHPKFSIIYTIASLLNSISTIDELKFVVHFDKDSMEKLQSF